MIRYIMIRRYIIIRRYIVIRIYIMIRRTKVTRNKTQLLLNFFYTGDVEIIAVSTKDC